MKRKKLVCDILHASVLTIKRMIIGSSGFTPILRSNYYFVGDGVESYIAPTTPLAFVSEDTVTFEFNSLKTQQANAALMSSTESNFMLGTEDGDTWSFDSGTFKVDGNRVNPGDAIDHDGSIHTAEFTFSTQIGITKFLVGMAGEYWNGMISNITSSDGVVSSFIDQQYEVEQRNITTRQNPLIIHNGESSDWYLKMDNDLLSAEVIRNGEFNEGSDYWDCVSPEWGITASGASYTALSATTQSLSQDDCFDVGDTYKFIVEGEVSSGFVGQQDVDGEIVREFDDGGITYYWRANMADMSVKLEDSGATGIITRISARKFGGVFTNRPELTEFTYLVSTTQMGDFV